MEITDNPMCLMETAILPSIIFHLHKLTAVTYDKENRIINNDVKDVYIIVSLERYNIAFLIKLTGFIDIHM